jgi:hypothetical protein
MDQDNQNKCSLKPAVSKYKRILQRVPEQQVTDLWNELNTFNMSHSLDEIVSKFAEELTKHLEFLN